MMTYLAPDEEPLDDLVAERAEVGEAPAAVAVPRAARLAQRAQARRAVRQDVGVVELRRANLLHWTQPGHLLKIKGSLETLFIETLFRLSAFFFIVINPTTFTHTCGDVVELKPLQEIDVTVEPSENRVGLQHQGSHPLLAQDDVHRDCSLQIASVSHLKNIT